MIRFARAVFCAVLLSAISVPAWADDAADAKAFVETVYARYADGSVTSPNWQMDIWDSQMLALMAEDEKLTPQGEVGVLDWDPICQCQDFVHLRATVTVKITSPTVAVATVVFNDSGMVDKSFSHAELDLFKERGHWRIHDIRTKDFENPSHSMRARFIEANAERRQGH